MAGTNLKTRIEHKHDVEANWILATNFTPKAGELIIYDADSTHNQPRLKIGDGTTKVNALPFSNYSIDEIDSMEFITVADIDAICGCSIVFSSEVEF
jgi:hypothetical protein